MLKRFKSEEKTNKTYVQDNNYIRNNLSFIDRLFSQKTNLKFQKN